MGNMTHKNLIFFFLSTSFLISATNYAKALDTLRPEDEDILWETDEEGKIKGYLYELTDAVYDERGNLIIREQIPVRTLGMPLQAIPVPEEVTEKAVDYSDPTLLNVNPDTPRTLNYPIGEERERLRAPLLEPYDPALTSLKKKSPKNCGRIQRLLPFRREIDKCMEPYKEQLDLELTMVSGGDSYEEKYKNTAYLTQTFAEIEQCYDNLGLDILEEFYPQDTEKLQEYNQRVKDFHVNGTDITFNTKYCGETCSVSALADLQMEKFTEFKKYLVELLRNAPFNTPKPKMLPANAYTNEDIEFLKEEDNQYGYGHRRLKTRHLEYDEDGVPLIDEDDVSYIDERDLQ